MNNVNPDNDPSLSNNHATLNTVWSQGDLSSDNLSHVSAEQTATGTGAWDGTAAGGSSLAYISFDDRARVTYGGYSNRTASAVYHAVGELNGSVGNALSDDAAISIAFDVGDLAPGESARFTYYYHFGPVDDISEVELFENSTLVTYDEDADGIANCLDLDSDNDSLPDIIEAGLTDADGNFRVDVLSDQGKVITPPDTDADGIPDFLDLESLNAANDGTAYDIWTGTFGGLDTNGDGRIDSNDTRGGNDANGNGIDDLVEDFDLDGIPNPVDPDDDNDGVNDTDDAFPLDPSKSTDADGDNGGDENGASPDDSIESADGAGGGGCFMHAVNI
jgi:hypothetical protein